jgi:hypothetical protein
MNYWFASVSPRKERFTSLTEAENYKHENGGSIKIVPVYESKQDVEDWIQEQDNSSLYLPMYFSEPSESTLKKSYESHSKNIQNHEIPKEIYFVI